MDANTKKIAEIVKRAASQGVLLREEGGELKFKLKVKQFPASVKQEVVQHKAAIVAFLSKFASGASANTTIVAGSRISANNRAENTEIHLPTSYAQQRLVLIDNLQGSTPEYNTPRAYKVSGQLDLALLTRVFTALIERHEIIRTRYQESTSETDEGVGHVEIQQCIRPMSAVNFCINQVDLSDAVAASTSQNHVSTEEAATALAFEDSQAVKDYINTSFATPFDLANDLMLRVDYVKTGGSHGVLLLNMHHIATDGWSMEILTKELFALYSAFAQQQANPLPELPIQYGDYACWQREKHQADKLEKQLDYWVSQLDELPTVHGLTLDSARPQVKQHQGAVVSGELPAQVAAQLNRLAKQWGLTPFMLYQGIFALMLSRHSNSHDIVMGTPVANRMLPELEPLIGFFVNTLVLRVDTQHDTLGDYLAHVQKVHVQAQANQDVPFEHLVDKLKPTRSQAHNPLFQIMMTTNTEYGLGQADEASAADLAGVSIAPLRAEQVQSKFDLHLSVNISGTFEWTFDTHLFEPSRIARFNEHFVRLLTAVSDCLGAEEGSESGANAIRLASLPMLSDEEVQRLTVTLNNTAADFPQDKCIHHFFEQQALSQPDAVAFVMENQTLTYRELNAQANQLAHYLIINHGVKPNQLVGLCTERSLSMVVGILAILKSGAAYVPLDPHLPTERLNYMLEDAALSVVLSHEPAKADLLAACKHTVERALILDDAHLQNTLAEYPTHNVVADSTGLTAGDLAYVIYTSGSTGKPKGVTVSHQALVNRIHWMNEEYGMSGQASLSGTSGSGQVALSGASQSGQDKVLQKTPYSFDVSVWEFVWTLGFGGQLVMAKPGGHVDPEYLCELIQREGITKLHFVPSMLGSILESPEFARCDSIEQVFCSGEALQQGHVQGFKATLPQAQLHNLYGPTEAAIDVSYWDCAGDISQGVPIGKPINNIQLLILDANMNLVPEGAVGELHIGGVGLAQGYLNREKLTKERFVDNPFHMNTGLCAPTSPRLYKTGDLARLRPDGNIEYQGRTDHQVKIRGFRIELGEVEHQLASLDGVDSALVMAQTLAGSQQLVGYVKASTGLNPNLTDDADALNAKDAFIAQCKQALLHVLPEYMVPSIFIVMDAWPTTANGKVDRKALPVLDSHRLHAHFVEPSTETEKALAAIWAQLLTLNINDISAEANFFELGGHSLLANTMLAKMRDAFEVNIKLDKVFTEPTIIAIAKVIDDLVVVNQLKKVEQEQEFLSGGVL